MASLSLFAMSKSGRALPLGVERKLSVSLSFVMAIIIAAAIIHIQALSVVLEH